MSWVLEGHHHRRCGEMPYPDPLAVVERRPLRCCNNVVTITPRRVESPPSHIMVITRDAGSKQQTCHRIPRPGSSRDRESGLINIVSAANI